ncbi:MAG: hypothetical protein KC877_02090 [Candidatus Kaiserbacteria bacterium]|nr:hypothetical protein [Candidatus Kaiserbacteria bacterium]MCB9816156.1 hypothetical protein [Candidatus Nomurabacteria bacterium]
MWLVFGAGVLGMLFRWHLKTSTIVGVVAGFLLFALFAHYDDPYHVYWGVTAAFVLGLTGMAVSKHFNIYMLGLAAGVSWLLIFMTTDDHTPIMTALTDVKNSITELNTFLIMIMFVVEAGVHMGILSPILTIINTNSKRTLMIIIGLMSFIMSAVLDNPTTAVVMGALLTQLTTRPENRLVFLAIIIAGANAGGIPSAIGNTTSLFLFMGGQITIDAMFLHLIVPSLVYMLVIFAWFWFKLSGNVERPVPNELDPHALEQSQQFHLKTWQQLLLLGLVLSGIALIVITKLVYHYEPWLAGILVFSIWGILTGKFHVIKGHHFVEKFNVKSALSDVDFETVVKFAFLIALVGAANYVGVLRDVANLLVNTITEHGSEDLVAPGIALLEGIVSAFMSNSALVASNQAMFGLDQYPTNHIFWLMLNYTTGVGGAFLPIGTAAGMILMSRFHSVLTMGAYIKMTIIPFFLAYVAGFAVLYADYLINIS